MIVARLKAADVRKERAEDVDMMYLSGKYAGENSPQRNALQGAASLRPRVCSG